MTPLLVALQFLTRLPIRLPGMPTPQQVGRSLLWYPLVGLSIGLALVVACYVLGDSPAILQAAVLLTLWVVLSGGLHLDGLADSADAWAGGFGDKERTLSIMKDPRSGPIAVVVLVLVLLLKFVALATLLEAGSAFSALLLVPLLGRSAMLALFLTTPYVRPGGLGQAMAEHLPRALGWYVLIASALACVLLGARSGLLAVVIAFGLFCFVRRLMCQRIDGTTGDTAGALLETLECGVLLGLAISA